MRLIFSDCTRFPGCRTAKKTWPSSSSRRSLLTSTWRWAKAATFMSFLNVKFIVNLDAGDRCSRELGAVQDQNQHWPEEADGHLLRKKWPRLPGPTFQHSSLTSSLFRVCDSPLTVRELVPPTQLKASGWRRGMLSRSSRSSRGVGWPRAGD